ncbi:MAG: hypothetical protein KatS3mg027_2664 [Bacteroidia bacterium]|nr:MAG: hypothetical protein KatS3mg027_2664 [Bacteroidia bacterium]
MSLCPKHNNQNTARLGMQTQNCLLAKLVYRNCPIPLYSTMLIMHNTIAQNLNPKYYTLGKKHYESTDRLGNVRVTYTDKKSWQQNKFALNVSSSQDYYPFGAVMEGRKYNLTAYRYAFNTQERVPELNESHYTALYWEYDGRLARRWNVDPEFNKFKSISLFSAFADNPFIFQDKKGNTVKAINEKAVEVIDQKIESFGGERFMKKLGIFTNDINFENDKGELIKGAFYEAITDRDGNRAELLTFNQFKRNVKEFNLTKEQINDAYTLYNAIMRKETIEVLVVQKGRSSASRIDGGGSSLPSKVVGVNRRPSYNYNYDIFVAEYKKDPEGTIDKYTRGTGYGFLKFRNNPEEKESHNYGQIGTIILDGTGRTNNQLGQMLMQSINEYFK